MIEKYKRLVFIILTTVLLSVSLIFIDIWILPKDKTDDTIVSYSQVMGRTGSKFSRGSKYVVCFKFYTKKGFEFSTEDTFVDENNIIIKRSLIFKTITSVSSETEDYSEKLTSGLNGGCLWFIIVLAISTTISLLTLSFYIDLSENGFLNIIMFNSLILFYALYLFAVYN